MNILIADDETPARNRLKRLINEYPDYNVIAEAKNGQEAIDLCAKHQPEIILMDIRMPGIDGLEAARIINEQDQPPAIIYCTAFSDHALKAFETHAVDYLLKPVVKERLFEALASSVQLTRAQIARSSNNSEPTDNTQPRQHICARVRGNLVLVPIENVYYFRADQKYVTVRHADGELLIEETLVSLEQEYKDLFLRIHRSTLVALDKIEGLEKHDSSTFVSLNAINETLEISRRHLPAVRKVIKNL
jgi:two-component system response regulator AlgR